jgi:hypothetical protein
MSFSTHTSRGRVPLLAIAVLSVMIGLAAAVLAVNRVSLLPPKLEPRGLETAGATTHVLVDFKRSKVTDRRESWPYFNSLKIRADLLARLMASRPGVEYIARRADVPASDLAAVAPVTAGVQSVLTEPGSEQRAQEILLADKRHRLEIQNKPDAPIIDIYAQSPTPAEAERLADASIEGLRDYLSTLAARSGFDPASQLELEQLGQTRGGVLNPGVGPKLGALAFMVGFSVSFALLFGLSRVLPRRRRRWRGETSAVEPGLGSSMSPTPALAMASPAPASPRGFGWRALVSSSPGALASPAPEPSPAFVEAETSEDAWPRTTRVLPWMLAGFIAVLWLVPFDSIQLNASLPIDLKFDRLVLPFVAVMWILALFAGGRDAPRLRTTWIHIAVGAFVTLACLSVILDAGDLNQALELETSLKKLPLLLAYLSLFVIMASTVRRDEVPAFIKFMLGLAVLCALGMLGEYKLDLNVFFDLAGKLPDGLFDVKIAETGYDTVGRRITQGPTAHPLVAVTMLSMALPIALVGVIHAKTWRERAIYGAAACVLMIAMLATQRKTGVVAPVAVVLTLAYLRRRELLRIAPAAVAVLIALALASPGTFSPVLDQFQPEELSGANTVSDRASDYDAIRPDVWTHLAFGRGYGSYQPVGHRILDSEILVRIVEMGAIGLVAFLLLGASVVATARPAIAARHPRWGPAALVGAAAAVVFLVVAALFDTMSYPQVPYIFLCFAALVAAIVTAPGADYSGDD